MECYFPNFSFSGLKFWWIFVKFQNCSRTWRILFALVIRRSLLSFRFQGKTSDILTIFDGKKIFLRQNISEIMDLNHLAEVLSCGSPDQLKIGFSSLLSLFPESSCESMQLANLLLPLVLELMKPFYSEDAMVQINCYFYVQVAIFVFLSINSC